MTLKQLAKQANVSTSTVSKALNNSPDISDETKRLILDLAEGAATRRNTERNPPPSLAFPDRKSV